VTQREKTQHTLKSEKSNKKLKSSSGSSPAMHPSATPTKGLKNLVKLSLQQQKFLTQ
jgi:hypothetical protein